MGIINSKMLKEYTWIVESDSMNKSLVVSVDVVKMHYLYKKRYIVSKKFYVHDEDNVAKKWDKVVIRETRPISKLKRWKLIEIIK